MHTYTCIYWADFVPTVNSVVRAKNEGGRGCAIALRSQFTWCWSIRNIHHDSFETHRYEYLVRTSGKMEIDDRWRRFPIIFLFIFYIYIVYIEFWAYFVCCVYMYKRIYNWCDSVIFYNVFFSIKLKYLLLYTNHIRHFGWIKSDGFQHFTQHLIALIIKLSNKYWMYGVKYVSMCIGCICI